ncbi:MAG: hypothetical protein K0R28_2374 [Paenibacillus sp.]|nr:hypothetical protein [Paenibacillus sp.]
MKSVLLQKWSAVIGLVQVLVFGRVCIPTTTSI